jgi:hypothetical protein
MRLAAVVLIEDFVAMGCGSDTVSLAECGLDRPAVRPAADLLQPLAMRRGLML